MNVYRKVFNLNNYNKFHVYLEPQVNLSGFFLMQIVRVKQNAIILPILTDLELELKGLCPHRTHFYNFRNLQNLDLALWALLVKPALGNILQMSLCRYAMWAFIF